MWAEERSGAGNEFDLEHAQLQMSVHPGRDDGLWKLVPIDGMLS